MRIAIIGGSGFIGRTLTGRLCEAGHAVWNLDVTPVADGGAGETYLPVDVQDAPGLQAALAGARPDCVYLLAAEHRDDVAPRRRYYDVNVGGARNVAQVLEVLGVTRLIFASSVAVYGLDAGVAREDAEPRPFNDYGRSKLEAESVLRVWAGADAARSLTIVRPCVVFGPGNRGNVHTLLRQIGSRAFVMIGSGRNRKSMAYVDNVAAFFEHVLHAPSGAHCYNYADQPDLTMNELVGHAMARLSQRPLPRLRLPYGVGLAAGYACDLLSRVTGRRLPISAVRVRKFCANTCVDASRAHAGPFVAPVDLRSGLDRMIDAEFGSSGA